MTKKSGNTKLLSLFLLIGSFSFSASTPPAFAQGGGYQSGDQIEYFTAGDWWGGEIIEAKENGEYLVRTLQGLLIPYPATSLRRVSTGRNSNVRSVPNNQPQNMRSPTNTPLTAVQAPRSINGRYGARDPRTCRDTKAPASGAITAALASRYFICQAERIYSGHLYLVENLRLQVGGGVPYTPNLGAFESINVRVPLYPIRGSYLLYQCKDLVTEHVGPPGTNCNTYSHPNAMGYCYKTTFGDWRCYLADRSNNPADFRRGQAPPRS